MSGLEKMKSQILDEANHSAETEIAQAKAQAEELLRSAEAEADAEAEKILEKSREELEHFSERIASSCDMYRKQAILKAKQEVIQEMIKKAYERIQNLDCQSYFAMIKKLVEKYSLPQAGVLCFSQEDIERLPDGFEQEIQEIAAAKGGSLAISKEGRKIQGGFILIYGGIEENCTIKALFEDKKEELSDKIHALLFA